MFPALFVSKGRAARMICGRSVRPAVVGLVPGFGGELQPGAELVIAELRRVCERGVLDSAIAAGPRLPGADPHRPIRRP